METNQKREETIQSKEPMNLLKGQRLFLGPPLVVVEPRANSHKKRVLWQISRHVLDERLEQQEVPRESLHGQNEERRDKHLPRRKLPNNPPHVARFDAQCEKNSFAWSALFR